MEIFGIGLPELLLILLIMLVVLGPRDMVKAGQKLGKVIRQVITSDAWRTMMNASREIRELPTKMVREAGLEEDLGELRRQTRELVEPLNEELRKINEPPKLEAASQSDLPQTFASDGKSQAATVDEENIKDSRNALPPSSSADADQPPSPRQIK